MLLLLLLLLLLLVSAALRTAVRYYSENPIPAIEDWDTSGVTDMSRLFRNKRDFKGNISGWNTASETDMSSSSRGPSTQPVQLEHRERDVHGLHVQRRDGLQRQPVWL